MFNKYIDKILNENKNIYAHTSKNRQEEKLIDHLELTLKYYIKMEKYSVLDIIIKNIIKDIYSSISDTVLNKVYEIFKAAIYYHDIGKINLSFQKNVMGNIINHNEELDTDDTHSALSARIFIDAYQKEILINSSYTNDEKVFLIYIVYYFSYIISRHHSKLETLQEFLETLKDKKTYEMYKYNYTDESLENFFDNKNIESFITKFNIDKISIYILCKLLYSCMITADFYATYEYMSNGKEVEFNSKKKSDLFGKYKKSVRYKSIEEYKKGKKDINGINKLRCDMFIEVEKNLTENLDKSIFYLEAPTGAGKTNIAINIARVLYENNNSINTINYIFPFNTLVEQTSQTFNKYFKKYNDYVVINSITPIVEEIDEKLDFDSAYMKNCFRQYPIVITSHINLFNSLFGIGKEDNYSLYSYVNSVVVIDEIQAYSNNIWRQFIEMLNKYAKLLNIKFIIMSATLPKLDSLLDKKTSSFVSLIEDKSKYYNNKIFKGRVSLDFSFLNEKIDLNKLKEKILEYKDKKVLVEFIKKDTARKMFNLLKEEKINVYELTGDDNSYIREQIINDCKESKSIVLVATQTIEAGVDIDMDIGFKDISYLDSEEQFIGRINRSSKKKGCIAYFFNYDNASDIYRNDARLIYDLNNMHVRGWFESKNFEEFYNNVLNNIYKSTNMYNKYNILNFLDNCSKLEYKSISKLMNLIENNTIQIYLNYKLEYRGQIVYGKDILDEYIDIYKNNTLSYSEKKIRLSTLLDKLNLFRYSVYNNKNNVIIGEKILGMYYIENGQDYIQDGKFNRDKFKNVGEELFL